MVILGKLLIDMCIYMILQLLSGMREPFNKTNLSRSLRLPCDMSSM